MQSAYRYRWDERSACSPGSPADQWVRPPERWCLCSFVNTLENILYHRSKVQTAASFKNNIMTGQLVYGSVVVWCSFDLQQMDPAAVLEIPWHPLQKNKKSAVLSSPSILHPGTVFIWISPPNPLSNDMTQWVTIPLIPLKEKRSAFGRERLKCSGKRGCLMNVRGAEYSSDYSISNLHLSREQISEFGELPPHRNSTGFPQQNSFCDYHNNLLESVAEWFYTKCLMLSAAWTFPREFTLCLPESESNCSTRSFWDS